MKKAESVLNSELNSSFISSKTFTLQFRSSFDFSDSLNEEEESTEAKSFKESILELNVSPLSSLAAIW